MKRKKNAEQPITTRGKGHFETEKRNFLLLFYCAYIFAFFFVEVLASRLKKIIGSKKSAGDKECDFSVFPFQFRFKLSHDVALMRNFSVSFPFRQVI